MHWPEPPFLSIVQLAPPGKPDAQVPSTHAPLAH
jgi:hypothetical protein